MIHKQIFKTPNGNVVHEFKVMLDTRGNPVGMLFIREYYVSH